MNVRLLLGALSVAGIAACMAEAAPYDGGEPFICAPLKIVSCEKSGECSKETADTVNLPQFLRFDIGANKITGSRPDGEALETSIDSVRHLEEIMALQGVQGHIVWNVTIAEATGQMTLIAAGDGAGYVAFGACTPR